MTTQASSFGIFNTPNTANLPFGNLANQSGAQTQGLFEDFLEEEPDIPFFGRLFEQGPEGRDLFTPNQQSAFRNQRQQFTDRFLALINEQIQGGELPTARFADFIGDFDFGQEFNQQFGPGTAAFAPRTRFIQ